jgi:molybdopterin-guanine dinucleotide biosynthesis protein A
MVRNKLELNHRLLGVVLCGGRSARMGRDKAGIPHPQGGTFLEVAAGRLRVVCDEYCISASADQAIELLPNIGRIDDPVAHLGPIVGVSTCLEYARQHGFAGCLVTPVDMPELTTEDLGQLRDKWTESMDQVVCAIDNESGRLEPLVAVYPVHRSESLRIAATSDDRSLFRWIERQNPTLVRLAPNSSRNVNAPQDL